MEERDLYYGSEIEILGRDILTISQDRDMIVNAWNPHSFPGNGNDSDDSLDGYLGRSTAILLTQTVHFNNQMRFIGVHENPNPTHLLARPVGHNTVFIDMDRDGSFFRN